ncbi:MAG: transposase [Treponema sp.]|nr:transposase [Treponema sp.]
MRWFQTSATGKLEEEYPVIWADALYEKIREGNRIVSMAVMVIKAINLDGKPDILAIEPMNSESEETYAVLFNDLKKRDVKKVWLCVSDAHTGLRAAIQKCWPGAS